MKPFKNIALAISGGGFRAAAFGLGTLSYLQYLRYKNETGEDQSLLQNVSFISSTSGGSITNALYSMYKHQGKSFDDCYKKLWNTLQGEGILDTVLKKMLDDAEWPGDKNGKNRNFINAFAKVYDEKLFDHKTFGEFKDNHHQNTSGVCFNATEFNRGLTFRFQNEGFFGNEYLHMLFTKLQTAQKIKIGDVVAASSCFPGGFEPIVYPNDFSHRDLSVQELTEAMLSEDFDLTKKNPDKPFGLMDGGVTDNQGLRSVVLADKRRKNNNHPSFDLVIIADVTSDFMEAYGVPREIVKGKWRKRNILWYAGKIKSTLIGTKNIITALALSLLISIPLSLFADTWSWKYTGIFFLFPGIAALFLLIRVWHFRKKHPQFSKFIKNPDSIDTKETLRKAFKLERNFSDPVLNTFMTIFKTMQFSHFEQMIKARLRSVLLIIFDINLKHARRVINKTFYEDENYNNRRVSNLIYELSEYNKARRTVRINTDPLVTEADKKFLISLEDSEMTAIAEEARTMGTTVWFDKKDTSNEEFKKIIACGQFTTCINLLYYIMTLENNTLLYTSFSVPQQNNLQHLKLQLIHQWAAFSVDPFFLFDEYKRRLGL